MHAQISSAVTKDRQTGGLRKRYLSYVARLALLFTDDGGGTCAALSVRVVCARAVGSAQFFCVCVMGNSTG